jgi:hypothetical protein
LLQPDEQAFRPVVSDLPLREDDLLPCLSLRAD